MKPPMAEPKQPVVVFLLHGFCLYGPFIKLFQETKKPRDMDYLPQYISTCSLNMVIQWWFLNCFVCLTLHFWDDHLIGKPTRYRSTLGALDCCKVALGRHQIASKHCLNRGD